MYLLFEQNTNLFPGFKFQANFLINSKLLFFKLPAELLLKVVRLFMKLYDQYNVREKELKTTVDTRDSVRRGWERAEGQK